jgi:hypothetical protein
MPLAVVFSAVSLFAFDSACTQTVLCQQACTPSSHALAPLYPGASSARAWCCGRWRGRRGVVNGLLVDTQGLARSRRSPASLQHHSRLSPIPHRRCTQHSTLLGAARTGTFWRFAGRPSPSPTAALAALRLAALSISADSRSRAVSKSVPMVVSQMQVRCRCAVCCECACRRVRVDVEPRPKPSPHHASANQFATINSSVVWQIATMRCIFFSVKTLAIHHTLFCDSPKEYVWLPCSAGRPR